MDSSINMQYFPPENHMNPQKEEIDLSEIWNAIWSGKFLIIVIVVLFSISSALYAIKQPNVYKATTKLAPSGEQNGAGGLLKMAGQFSGLASLAGINLGGGGGVNKLGITLEVLKSRAFIERFIVKYDLFVNLFAVKGWNPKLGQLEIDTEIYDINNDKWLFTINSRENSRPTLWMAYKQFKSLFNVLVDQDTGMITLSVEHYSPEVAKHWLEWIVQDINETMREQDVLYAENSVNFLTEKLSSTQLADMQTMFYQLIEEQTKTIMLAEVSKEYILRTIEPANTPDERAKPNRVVMVILGTLLGGIIALMVVLIRHFKFRYK